MKRTLLSMVQSVLSSMDSDEVNSIHDTVESRQVVDVFRQVHDDIQSRLNLPELYTLFELQPSNDIERPTLMYVPDYIDNVLWIKYNTIGYREEDQAAWAPIKYVEPTEMLDYMHGLDRTADNVQTYTLPLSGTEIEMYCETDKSPEKWTSFDDHQVVFDSYHTHYDSTLQRNKTLAYGEKISPFALSDSFVAEFDNKEYQIWFNEAKAMCFAELKQQQHATAERQARKGWIHSQKVKQNTPANKPFFNTTPNYGRK